MAIELWFFLARPVLREIGAWGRQMRLARHTRRARLTALAGLGLVLLLLVPWRAHLVAPATLRAARQTTLYTDESGIVVSLHASGDRLAQGQTVAVLRSPELEHQAQTTQARLDTLHATLASRTFDPEQTAGLDDTIGQIAKETAERTHVQAALQLLTLRAPFAGRLVDMTPDIRIGDMLHRHEQIGTLITPDDMVIEAYVDEADIARVQPGARARFRSDIHGRRTLAAHVISVAPTSLKELDVPEQASLYGGAVQVHKDAAGHMVPDGAFYRVTLRVDAPDRPVTARLRGSVAIDCPPTSIMLRVYRRAVSVLMGEAGF
ncbi:efflux RND transporter periplasmic adaptor subunit [Gluconacetobacter johannae]|nr:HlyD family efflux transporter periplasmic adaptor subunit [Gluconacetobacter johannae]